MNKMEPYAFWCSRCKVSHAGECPTPKNPCTEVATEGSVDWARYLPFEPLPADTVFSPWAPGDVVAMTGSVNDMVVKVLSGPRPAPNGGSDLYVVQLLVSRYPKYRNVGEIFDLARRSPYGEHSQKVA